MKKTVLTTILVMCIGGGLLACSNQKDVQSNSDEQIELAEDDGTEDTDDILVAQDNSNPTAAWGNSGGTPRDTYTKVEIDEAYNNGTWGDKITFNSITDGDFGDERNFVRARDYTDGKNDGVNNVWSPDEIIVEDDHTYRISMFVHNNSPMGRSGVAKDTHVSFSIPDVNKPSSEVEVTGFINSSNATPNEYWDGVVFKSKDGQAFHLEYVYNSALLQNNGAAATEDGNGVHISNDIVKAASGGTLIGFDSLNGEIPGCYEFSSFVDIEVKAVYDMD